MGNTVSISRDPEDSWAGNHSVSFRGTDQGGPVVIVIEDAEWSGILDIANIETGSDGTEIPDLAFEMLEDAASKEAVKNTENGRLIDLRPMFD